MVNGAPYTDVNGRVLYADSISATNAAIISATNSQTRVITRFNNVNFDEGAIFLTNQSKAYNYSLTGQLRKRFGGSLEASTAYTYVRSKDVQSLTSDRAVSNFRNGRTFAGLESEPELGTSAFERRHNVKAFATYTAPWKNYPTDISVNYQGTSGIAITYTANGDLNGDGVVSNDPLYIPRNANNPSEIRVVSLQDPSRPAGATNPFVLDPTAAVRFDNFISDQKCLDRQRGQIMERNSCRGPWQNLFNASVRQSLPELAGQRLTVQLDIFNFANLLNSNWGRIYSPTLSSGFPQQQALISRGRQPGALNQSLTNFEFAPLLVREGKSRIADNSVASLYQMQLTLRYAF